MTAIGRDEAVKVLQTKWYIPKEVLKEQFDPSKSPRETYLLCKIWWGETGTPWIHWVKNDGDDRHAEVCFLEDVILMKRSNVNCNIILYLSWSPCADCSCRILDFLKQHSNVTIGIVVARLYRVNSEENRKGLRKLDRSSQVNLRVMEMRDYKYCWRAFTRGGDAYDFWPRNNEPEIIANLVTLHIILEDLIGRIKQSHNISSWEEPKRIIKSKALLLAGSPKTKEYDYIIAIYRSIIQMLLEH